MDWVNVTIRAFEEWVAGFDLRFVNALSMFVCLFDAVQVTIFYCVLVKQYNTDFPIKWNLCHEVLYYLGIILHD